MTRQENPNFVASKYAPNPKEVSYWIDLSSDTTGNVIKSFDGKQWIPTNYKENTDQSERIDELDASLASEISRAKSKEEQLMQIILILLIYRKYENAINRESINELDSSKADKATTLAGYGITDAYTKSQADSKATEIAKAECAKLVASAPETLDTLDEIAAALGDDPNFATTITNLIGTKADTATVNASLDTKADKATTYTKSEVDTKLNAKANSVDVYTKSQTNTAISDATNNKVTSTSVNSIQIVDAIPEADSQVTGVLYIKLSTAA